MRQRECIAMILAGGKGERLGSLTNRVAKPVIFYGGKYRIIDFTLSNCVHSKIEPIGVLTQYKPVALHDYINNGQAWNFSKLGGGVYMLPSSRCAGAYTGTANAVYQNIDFIDKFDPQHVLILSGDHIYKMDYRKMLDFHKKKNADVTISTVSVPLEEASRFGILSVDHENKITEFEEKPKHPKSQLASMGIYIFKWSLLKRYLIDDALMPSSSHDFGKNVIPAMFSAGDKMYTYRFDGYWRDVGTVQSLWEANMDLISNDPPIDLHDSNWNILTKSQHHAPCYLSPDAEIKRSIVAEGCQIYGKLSGSVLFNSVIIGEGAEVKDSVLMPGATIGKNAKVYKSVIGNGSFVGVNAEIGAENGISAFLDKRICSKDISLIGPGVYVERNLRIMRNSHVNEDSLQENYRHSAMERAVLRAELVYA